MKLNCDKLVLCSTALTFALWATAASAPLELLRDEKPHGVWGGGQRPVKVVWRNPGDQMVELPVRVRLYQTTSATAVLLSEKPWETVQVLPRQTVWETASVDFPEVQAETPFVLQWLEDAGRVLGTTEVLAYPPDLLKELKSLAGGEPLGVFDPQNQLKPLLKNLALDFEDLENKNFEAFSGGLAVVGPFVSKAEMPRGLANRIAPLAGKGVGVVWIQPPTERSGKVLPSFYSVAIGRGAVVVVQAELVSHLSDRPQAQLNLIQFARLALHPEPARLPHLTPRP